MHPVIMRQLAADHIAEIHAKAEDERLTRHARRARRAWRRVPSMRLRLRASETLSLASRLASTTSAFRAGLRIPVLVWPWQALLLRAR